MDSYLLFAVVGVDGGGEVREVVGCSGSGYPRLSLQRVHVLVHKLPCHPQAHACMRTPAVHSLSLSVHCHFILLLPNCCVPLVACSMYCVITVHLTLVYSFTVYILCFCCAFTVHLVRVICELTVAFCVLAVYLLSRAVYVLCMYCVLSVTYQVPTATAPSASQRAAPRPHSQ